LREGHRKQRREEGEEREGNKGRKRRRRIEGGPMETQEGRGGRLREGRGKQQGREGGTHKKLISDSDSEFPSTLSVFSHPHPLTLIPGRYSGMCAMFCDAGCGKQHIRDWVSGGREEGEGRREEGEGSGRGKEEGGGGRREEEGEGRWEEVVCVS
jgi:hypothetical protein